MNTQTEVQTMLGLTHPPVAVGFFDRAPDGVAAWNGGPVAAGCVFWKAAQNGQTFYTTPADHFHCAVGAYTHAISLPMERAGELEETLDLMVGADYLAMDEVPSIPTLPSAPAFLAYGPAGQVPFDPSVVLLAVTPAEAMLIYETALQAQIAPALMPALGRPACAILPLSLGQNSAALSLGCKGNRTFTGLTDDALYVSIAGAAWPALLAQFPRTRQANRVMGDFYAQKQERFAAL